ncbi:unnamed protein product, partial [Staurois parvus]
CISHAESHTLRYYHTVLSHKRSAQPEFFVSGYLDDKEIVNYNSESHMALPVALWMEENEGPEYWERETLDFKGMEPVCKYSVKATKSHLNQTRGVHCFQVTFGCELNDDGSTNGYCHIGYDGRDFAYLDTQRWIYIPTMPKAEITTQEWNSPGSRAGERRKNYLENICIPKLRQYIQYGRKELEKKVRPEVKVWGRRQSDGVTRLQCLVYGFHPRPVDVKWMRNGEDHVPSDEMTPILPHPDGTYQIRVSVEVPTKEGDTYSCHVDHSSLGDETLSVKWEPDMRPWTIVIVPAIICLLVAVAVICGVFLYKKRKNGYKTTSTSDRSSDSSNPRD